MRSFIQWLKSLFAPKPKQLPSPDGRELPAVGEHRKIRLAIIVGHTKASPGASLAGTKQCEYQYNTEVAEIMADEARRIGSIDPVIIFRDGVGIEGAYKKAIAEKCDAAIELHFNAFNGRADGTEALCTSDLNDVEFAHIIQNAMCRVFARAGQSRGVKAIAKSARGGGNVHSFPGGVNCLVEPAFGDNPREARMLIDYKVAYASALVQAVNLWATKKDLV